MQHRILVLENEFGLGGSEKKLFEFISRAEPSRLHIAVCCLKAGGHFKPKLEEIGVPFYDNLLRHPFDAWAFRKLVRVLRAERPHIIYTFAHPNTVLFAWLAKRLGLVDSVLVSFHATGNPEGGRLVPGYLRAFLRRADALVAVAHTQKEYLAGVEGLPADLIRVIHNGVNTSVYRPAGPGERARIRTELGLPASGYVMITVASLKPAKRIDLLMRAAAPFLRDHDEARLLLVGDGPSRGQLEELAGSLGIAGKVVFAGVRDDVGHVLRAADVLVLSSRAGTETLPNVILEAMATGLPVVSTEVGSVREMVEEGRSALIVPQEDEAALRDAIERMAAAGTLRESFGVRGQEIVNERFRIETMCDARERLFGELVSRTGRNA